MSGMSSALKLGNLKDFSLIFLVWDWSSSSESSSSDDEWEMEHKAGKFKLPMSPKEFANVVLIY